MLFGQLCLLALISASGSDSLATLTNKSNDLQRELDSLRGAISIYPEMYGTALTVIGIVSSAILLGYSIWMAITVFRVERVITTLSALRADISKQKATQLAIVEATKSDLDSINKKIQDEGRVLSDRVNWAAAELFTELAYSTSYWYDCTRHIIRAIQFLRFLSRPIESQNVLFKLLVKWKNLLLLNKEEFENYNSDGSVVLIRDNDVYQHELETLSQLLMFFDLPTNLQRIHGDIMGLSIRNSPISPPPSQPSDPQSPSGQG